MIKCTNYTKVLFIVYLLKEWVFSLVVPLSVIGEHMNVIKSDGSRRQCLVEVRFSLAFGGWAQAEPELWYLSDGAKISQAVP